MQQCFSSNLMFHGSSERLMGRHVVGVKGKGERERWREKIGGLKSIFILPLRPCWWNERCMCLEEKSSALAGLFQPPPETSPSRTS
ncbi:Atp-Binding Cassette Sub-Family A Member 12 [Manis pentadactyla]|nr:Atp-Binding Cassette Sub-Family A Member 12 [Manis pentadactyla]